MTWSAIIAVCGDSGAGKSTTTGLLKEQGFEVFSLSGFLRSEAETAHDGPTRLQVQEHGKTMQSKYGNDYYARRLLNETDILSCHRAVIDGVRNLDEMALLRDRAARQGRNVHLLSLTVNSETRFQRVIDRRRSGDPTEMSQFIADDARANGTEGDFQNNQALIAVADWQIENDGDTDALRGKLQALLKEVDFTSTNEGTAREAVRNRDAVRRRSS